MSNEQVKRPEETGIYLDITGKCEDDFGNNPETMQYYVKAHADAYFDYLEKTIEELKAKLAKQGEMMDKFLIIYNVKSMTFPLCGFVTEENRNLLLRKFEECNREKFVFYDNDNMVEVDCSEIIEALKNPFTIDMTKVPQEIVSYDPATYIAEREMFFELQEDGTLHELPLGDSDV